MDDLRLKIPEVKVFKTKDGVQYFFWCGYCNCFHRHGAGEDGEGHRIAHCTNPYSPYLFDGYILKEYTQKELREIGLPIDYYKKRVKQTKR